MRQFFLFLSLLLDELFVLQGNRLDVGFQTQLLLQLELQALLEGADFLEVHRQLAEFGLQGRGLALQLLGFVLFLEHHLLQLLAVVVQLATLVLEGLRLLGDLDDGRFDDGDLVAEELLRLLLLLGELALQRCHAALVAHVVGHNRLAHRVKRDRGPPRTIELVGKAQLCLRAAPLLVVDSTHATHLAS